MGLFQQWGKSDLSSPQFVTAGWDNRVMRTKLASVIVILGLFGSSMASIPPASALFGLSQCEKVKKKILSYEKQKVALSRGVSSFAGQLAYKFTINQNRSNYLKMKNFASFELTYLRYAYNNSKCFTRSQNEFINSSYKYAQDIQNMFISTPYFLDAWQSGRMLFTYPYGKGPLVSIYSK